jgi:hypothetical protein
MVEKKKNLGGCLFLWERMLTLEDDKNAQKNPSQQVKKMEVVIFENPLFSSSKKYTGKKSPRTKTTRQGR